MRHVSGSTPRVLGGILLALALLSCGISDQEYCTAEAYPAVRVHVENAQSGAPITDALAVARDGSYADSTRSRSLSGAVERALAELAYGRPGTYDITVEKDGFSPWIRSNIEVDVGECFVNTVELTARLSPA